MTIYFNVYTRRSPDKNGECIYMKDTNLIIRISKEQLEKFEEACRKTKRKKSEVIRIFIDRYITNVSKTEEK